jgi:GNAT superfamily N-acetyltransferase
MSSNSVSLVPLTLFNYLHAIKICVLPEQDQWTATVEGTIADAHFDDSISMRLIQHSSHGPVGFLAWSEGPGADRVPNRFYHLKHMRIAHQYQGHGFAREALAGWLKDLHRPCVVSTYANVSNARAVKLYTRVGFKIGRPVLDGLCYGELVLHETVVTPVAASTCAGDDSSWCEEHGKQSCPRGGEDEIDP